MKNNEKEKVQKILDKAIANCKENHSRKSKEATPCYICSQAADMQADTNMHVDGIKLEVGVALCENCYDNVRAEIETIDPDTIDL